MFGGERSNAQSPASNSGGSPMKRRSPLFVLGTAVLAAAGFAVASIASGASLLSLVTTGETTTGSATTTGTTPTGRRVVVCHVTGSKSHPAVTITVDQHAVAAV